MPSPSTSRRCRRFKRAIADRELANASLSALTTGIRSGRVSPIELTEIMLDRIARFDPVLHSYATVGSDNARKMASVAAADIQQGRWRGPLHGIPIAVKDVFFTTEVRTRLGSPIYDDWQPPYESTVTRRLRAAGAVLLGKLALTEGVYADHHPSVAAPVNPFCADYWTGTSSSGSGVAVTAALCYGALGSDTGGSIRLPAACCGVVGIKPTWGRVSRYGVFPLAESLDHVGPMARSVADAAALLTAIAGPDPADPTAVPALVPDYSAELEGGVSALRIGVDWSFIEAKSSGDVQRSIAAVLAIMNELDAHIVNVTFPPTDDILRGWAVQCAVEAAMAHRSTYPARKAQYGERLAGLLERGAAVTAFELNEALRGRREFTGRVAMMFAAIDVLVVPGLPVAGPSLADMAALGNDPAAILAIGPFTAPFNVCGYPTITLPCGVSPNGIPIGFQFVGKPFAEGVLCRAAHAYQQVTDWHERRPRLETLGA